MFKCNTVKEAIGDTKKSKALGPDRITPIHLNHLGPIPLRYLTDTINLSVNRAQISNIWKVGRAIPLQKPGKAIDEFKTFRLIAVLFPIANLTEKLLLSEFIEYSLKEYQHGSRPEHSTTTALNIVTNNIQKGLNQKKPLLKALDLTAAFDTVDHNLLLRDILEAPPRNSARRWVASYLQGRFSYAEYNNKSKWRKVKKCVRQGGIIANALQHLHEQATFTPERYKHHILR